MRLIVNKDWHSWQTSFYLQDDRGSKRVIIGQKDGHLVEYSIDETSAMPLDISPLLKMNEMLATEFIKAFTDYLSEQNIKTENENLLEGKLKATEKHLDDLRLHFDKVLNKVIAG